MKSNLNLFHSYRAFGLLLVCCSLVGFGSLYGQDIIHPTSGTNTVNITSGDTRNYYDSGGADCDNATGGYSNNETGVSVLCPSTSGDVITIEFLEVDIETRGAPENCWDFLSIHDGNSTAAPLLISGCGEDGFASCPGGSPGDGSDCGNAEGSPCDMDGSNDATPSNNIFTSTAGNGCLTVSFESDGSLPQGGWVATVTTIPVGVCTTPPTIDCPSEVTVDVGDPTDPTATGTGTAMAPCGLSSLDFTDISVPGCGSTETITRTWTVTDNNGAMASCDQTINVVDTTPPTVDNCGVFEATFSRCPGFLGPNTPSGNWSALGSGIFISTAGGSSSQTVDVSACVSDGSGSLAGIERRLLDSYSEDRTDCSLTIVNEYAFRDLCGNIADETVLVKFMFEDPGVAPTITCPADVFVECGMSTDPSATGMATADDDCPADPTVSFSDMTTASCGSGAAMIARTWTATDQCGGTVSCVQNITIVDSQPPMVTCSNFTVDFDNGCAGNLSPNVPSGGFGPLPANGIINVGIGLGTGASYDLDLNGCVSDDCTDGFSGLEISLASSTIGASTTCGQTLTNTYSIRDACGNVADDLVTIVATFGDTEAPTVACADFEQTFTACPSGYGPNTPNGSWVSVPNTGVIMSAFGGGAFVVPADINSCVNDNCSDLSDLEYTLADSYFEGTPTSCLYVMVNELFVRDQCGNVADDRIIIRARIENGQNSPPDIVCPANTTIECGDSTDPADTGMATATDDCGNPMITFSDSFSASGCSSTTGVITRTWIATDGCDEMSSCVQNITIVDTTPPSITCPANLTINCGDSIDPMDIGMATGSDDCGGVDIDFLDGFTFNGCGSGTAMIARSWTATDDCGLTSDCIQTITVVDNTAPIVNCADFTMTFEGCPGSLGANTPDGNWFPIGVDGGFTAASGSSFTMFLDLSTCITDECSDLANLEVTLADSYEEDRTDCSVTLINEFFVRDECGNVADDRIITRFTIENTSDIVIVCPANVDIACGSPTTPADTGMATATDDCGDVDVSFSDEITMRCNTGAYAIIRTWTAEGCGTPASCEQLIILRDSEAPMFDAACQVDDTFFTEDGELCPADATISLSEGDELSTNDTWTVGGNTMPSLSGCLSDNCAIEDEIVITVDDITITNDGTCSRTIEVTFIADDGCGNDSDPFTFSYVFTDDTAPVFDLACQVDLTFFTEDGNVCPADAIFSLNEGDEIDVFTGWTVGGVAIPSLQGCVGDNCTDEGDLTITVDDITVVDDRTCSRVITVTFIADDGCGNDSDPFVCNYTFIDNTAPEVSFNGIPDGGTHVVECDLPSTNWDPLTDIGELTITDNCSAIDVAGITEVLTQLYDGPCVGNLLTRWQQVFTVMDVCGNTTVYTLFTEIIDTTPPVFESSPNDVTIECDKTAEKPDLVAFDSCSEVIYDFTEVRTDGSCPNNYTLTRTWTATDGCGNSSQEVQIVTVEDTTPPVIEFIDGYINQYEAGQDVFIDCRELGNIMQLIANNAVATDNCSGNTEVDYRLDDLGNFDCVEFGYIGRFVSIWESKDECGNSSVATINWYLVDESAPVFQNVPDDVCAGSNLPPVADVQAVDECDYATVNFSQSEPIDCEGGQYIERTWTAFDPCGNTATATQRILLGGNANGPTISIDYPAIGDVNDGDLIQLPIDCSQSLDFSEEELKEAISINAGCGSGDSSIELTLMDEGDCTENGYVARYSVNITASDPCGNTANFDLTIDFVDETGPVVNSPEAITLNCGDDIPMIMATDACGEIRTITFLDNAAIETSCAINPVAYDRVWMVTDICGNMTTFTQSITIIDSEGPIFSGVPADACNDLSIDGVVTAMDACTGEEAEVMFSEETTNEADCGEVTTRTWTATDACGNTSTATQQVFFDDEIAPEISFNNDLLFGLESGDELYISVGNGNGDPNDPMLFTSNDVIVTDNCATLVADVMIVTTISNDCEADGYLARYNYRFTAVDPCGNRSRLLLTVYYLDKSVPDFFNTPEDVEVFCSTVPAVAEVIVSDDYDEDVDVVFSETQTATDEGVLITRTWTATDDCGNVNSFSQEILVVDNDLSASFSFDNPEVICNSDDNLLEVTAIGGTPPYSYEWELTTPLEDGYITSDPTFPAVLFTMGYISQTFSVLIKDDNGCEFLASVKVDCDFSDDEGDFLIDQTGNGGFGLNAYPNPAQDYLRVKSAQLSEKAVDVKLFNLYGQEVLQQKVANWPQEGYELNTNRLPNGTYLLRVIPAGEEPISIEVVILR